MSSYTRVSKAFQNALILPLDECSKYVIISDCHRGVGNGNDNFLKNESIYLAALRYYFLKGFTYLELGDGDELWENFSIDDIKAIHPQTFELMSKFYQGNRFFSVYGNHDMVKKSPAFSNKYFSSITGQDALCHKPLFPGITFYSGIILRDKNKKRDIFLTHGNQADVLNSTFWRISCFLVRYFWKPLEKLGVPDPTSAAKNNTQKRNTEKKLTRWSRENECILITGHTHHPMVGTTTSPYFNTGSCVSPGGITCIEIENRCITLVKWYLDTRPDRTLFVARKMLGDKVFIDK